MKKRMGWVICLLLALFCAAQAGAEDTVYTAADWEFTLDEAGGATLTRYLGGAVEIEIPEIIQGDSRAGYPVVALGESAFEDNITVERITCPDTLQTIGEAAFRRCSSLQSIRLPQGLAKLEHYLFTDCYALSEIELPNTLASIGRESFMHCQSLQSVVFPDALETIRSDAFYGCTALSTVMFGDNVSYIGAHAFDMTPFLESNTNEFVTLGNRVLVRYNGTDANVIVPPWVKIISSAFEGCDFIETIELPQSLTTLAGYAMKDCTGLRSVTLPQGVRSVEDYVFAGCVNLSEIHMDEALSYIGESALRDCRALEEILLPDSVTTIEARAFSGCIRLTNVKMPKSLKTLGSGAFRDCVALEKVVFYQDVEKISASAFEGTSGLSLEVVYGTIGEAYAQEQELPFVYTAQQNEDYVYERDENGIRILQYIGRGYDVMLPEEIDEVTVYAIGPGAFQQMEKLDSIVFPASLKRLEDWAFAWCTGLTELELPEGISFIGNDVFHGCSGLTQVYLPRSVQTLGKGVFAECGGITVIADVDSLAYAAMKAQGFPVLDALTEGGEWVFERDDSDALWVRAYAGSGQAAAIPEAFTGRPVIGIRSGAINRAELESVTIEGRLQTIEQNAFGQSQAPMDIFFLQDADDIAEGAFASDAVLHAKTGTQVEQYARDYGNKFLVTRDR